MVSLGGRVDAPARERAVGRLADHGSHFGRLRVASGAEWTRTLAFALPTQNPELMREVLLTLALSDDSLSGVEAAELADRALGVARGNPQLDPPAALEAAKQVG
jgi:hypothetical protein